MSFQKRKKHVTGIWKT